MMGTTCYHHAKFGEDRTTRAGCRCENTVFVFFVTLRGRRAVRSMGILCVQMTLMTLFSVFAWFYVL